MATRHAGHQAREQRAEPARQGGDQAGLFGDLQEAEPQAQRAEQQDHDLDREPGHVEQAGDHRREHGLVAAEQPAGQGGDAGAQEEAEPESVEHALKHRTVAAIGAAQRGSGKSGRRCRS